MKLFVTGSSGKVGSRVSRYLHEKGHDLRVLIRTEEQARVARQYGWEAVCGDLAEPQSLISLIAGVDAVLHLAAFFRDAAPPDQIMAINERGTIELARAALQAKVTRFVFTSTTLVYGSGEGHASVESEFGRPASPYPQSKLAAEQGLMTLCERDGLDLSILRLAFVYGDGDSQLMDWLPLLKDFPGNRKFQFIHHADVCRAIDLVLSPKKQKSRIYNVADDEPLEVSELFQLLAGSSGPSPEALSEQTRWEGIMDSTRIRKELGFHPKFRSIRDAFAAKAL